MSELYVSSLEAAVKVLEEKNESLESQLKALQEVKQVSEVFGFTVDSSDFLKYSDYTRGDLLCLVKKLQDAMRWRDVDYGNMPPFHSEILLYREDAGVMLGQFTSLESFMPIEEAEKLGIGDESYFQDSWWAFSKDGLDRLDDDGDPTHWMPLPKPPQDK